MTPERNKAAALAEFEVWSSGEVGRLDDLSPPTSSTTTRTRPRASRATIERFAGGRVVESWRCMDMLGLVQQLGDGGAPGSF